MLQLQLRWSQLHFTYVSAVRIISTFYVSALSLVKANKRRLRLELRSQPDTLSQSLCALITRTKNGQRSSKLPQLEDCINFPDKFRHVSTLRACSGSQDFTQVAGGGIIQKSCDTHGSSFLQCIHYYEGLSRFIQNISPFLTGLNPRANSG